MTFIINKCIPQELSFLITSSTIRWEDIKAQIQGDTFIMQVTQVIHNGVSVPKRKTLHQEAWNIKVGWWFLNLHLLIFFPTTRIPWDSFGRSGKFTTYQRLGSLRSIFLVVFPLKPYMERTAHTSSGSIMVVQQCHQSKKCSKIEMLHWMISRVL